MLSAAGTLRPRPAAAGTHTQIPRASTTSAATTPHLTLVPAASPSDRLAAARLRAAAFATTLPPSTSVYARRAYVVTRTADAWGALEARAAGEGRAWGGVTLDTLLGVVPAQRVEGGEEGTDGAAASSRLDGDAGVLLVAPAGAPPPPSSLAIATLDLNTGRALPSERLAAPLPDSGGVEALTYLSNVAVAPRWRRRGYGRALLAAALARAASRGARRVAVHVEVANTAGMALYGGFFGEAKDVETAQVEREAGRPRRALFWVDL